MSAQPGTAFVVGLGANGYGIVRSLAQKEVPVLGAYRDAREDAREFGRFSRHAQVRALGPSVRDESQICRQLIEWRRGIKGPAVLFATSDDFAVLFARQKDVLAPHFLFHWTEATTLRTIVDKSEISLFCQQRGVCAPRTHFPTQEEDVAESVTDFPFPCIVKAVRSFDSPFPPSMRNAIAHSPAELLALYQAHPGFIGKTIWQEIIEGGDENVFQCNALVRQDRSIEGLLTVRKLRQHPSGFGSMSYGRSEENAEVVAESVKFLSSLRYRGLASLEFKYRRTDSRYYFIEMNPRLPWYNSLITDAGVNLAHLAYLDLTGQLPLEGGGVCTPRTVYWVGFEADRRWFIENRRLGKARFLRWLRSIARARSFAWWNWRDFRPFVASAWCLLKLIPRPRVACGGALPVPTRVRLPPPAATGENRPLHGGNRLQPARGDIQRHGRSAHPAP